MTCKSQQVKDGLTIAVHADSDAVGRLALFEIFRTTCTCRPHVKLIGANVRDFFVIRITPRIAVFIFVPCALRGCIANIAVRRRCSMTVTRASKLVRNSGCSYVAVMMMYHVNKRGHPQIFGNFLPPPLVHIWLNPPHCGGCLLWMTPKILISLDAK